MPPALIDLPLLIEDAQLLEPLPASTTRLAALAAGDAPDLQEVIEVVRLDQALTGRLLSAANSVVSGPRQEIDSIEHAVVRLGPGMVLALAIGGSVRATLSQALEAYDLAEGQLWRHSVACALAIDRARAYCSRPTPGHAFSTAILHDVGKLVLARHLTPEVRSVLQSAQSRRGLSREDAEIEVLHVCHARVGAMICDAWGLPSRIGAAVRYHHRPLSARDEVSRRLCQLLGLAEAVAADVGASASDGEEHRFDGALAGSLGITRAGFEALVDEVGEVLEDVLALYGP